MLEKKLLEICRLFCPFEIKRERKLSLECVLRLMLMSVVQNLGISSISNTLNICNSSSIYRFRKKFKEDYFKCVNSIFHNKIDNQKNRIFFLDGSKIHVKRGFVNFGYKSRTSDVSVARKAKRPIAMLSCLVSEASDSIFDYCLSKHFNERTSAIYHFSNLKKR